MIYFCLSCSSSDRAKLLDDILELSILEKLPDEFNPLPFQCRMDSGQTDTGLHVTMTERTPLLHLTVSLATFCCLFLCVDFVPGIIFHSK